MKAAFLVNGDERSAMGHRARAFAARLPAEYKVRVLYRSGRKIRSVARFVRELLRFRPQVVYVLDMAYSGVAAGSLYKRLAGGKLVIDTGDAITELARSLGRGRIGLALTRLLEKHSLRDADRLVVRGTYHREWLAARGVDAEVIPDGVETDLFTPAPADVLRKELGLEGVLTVGLVGTSLWSERLQICYGWDLVDVIRLLKDQPIAGVLVGGGSGISVLQARCREYGIEDRIRFLGPQPYERLPAYLNLMDVCLSTQTDDLPGRVRTTGKLPLYLATGRYILASRVGEAARLLDDAMLVEFSGVMDPNYPQKLAERLRPLLEDRSLLRRAEKHTALAREQFDYAVLAGKVADVLTAAATEHPLEQPAS